MNKQAIRYTAKVLLIAGIPAVSATNVWGEKCSSIYERHGSLLAIDDYIAIKKDPIADSAIGAQISS